MDDFLAGGMLIST